MTNKKTIIVSIIAVALFVVAISSVSYAFFTTNVIGIGENTVISGETANLSVNFVDQDVINITNMIPGDHFSKTFTLENNGTDISYKIVVNELINEFESFEDITYVLKENDIEIKEGIFPNLAEENELSNIRTIRTNERKTYTLIITYQNTEVDQKDDMGKTISGKLFIKEL